MDSKRIFVLGWYGHDNIGDESFKTAFQSLWPQFAFTFGDKIPKDIDTYSAMWVGGGSFLESYQKGIEKVTIPLAFLGVGLSKDVHPLNKEAMDRAKIVVVRDQASLEFHPSAIVGPDLAMASPTEEPNLDPPGKNVVILLNEFMATRGNQPTWQTRAFDWFCHEFAGACDRLVDEGFQLRFLPMCTGVIDDRRMAAYIIGKMEKPNKVYWGLELLDEHKLRAEINQARMVISQRFHGIVFSIQMGTPFIPILVHDKINGIVTDTGWPASVNYFGLHKDAVKRAWDSAWSADRQTLLDYAQDARKSWESISVIVANAFSG
jgi:polysaccharide pyruvyl transferase WcaK-like protein